ncbi:MAG: pantoate--beta-alanine ligase [Bacteroidetes bacterium B1(2017)]|nr:MAG: pantoate--beta-alanine ligase [Bacteroidetes bacterium B1(2017)]
MILFQSTSDLRSYISEQKAKNLRIGFVPTMGALHAGHLSLIKIARQKCDLVVCSIFVNPTQFNVASDLETYPRPLSNDIRLLSEGFCDVLFNPSVDEVYGNDFTKDSSDDYGSFIHLLEGASRPGHFDGVITVVKKLFLLVQPDEVFFGQKDYQQCLVIQTLIERNFPFINFNLCPIARENNGLAMSSRNVRLSKEEFELASDLFKNLTHILTNWKENAWLDALLEARTFLSKKPFELEYLEVCDQFTLEPLKAFKPNAIALVAVQLGKTRLIDNLLLKPTL